MNSQNNEPHPDEPKDRVVRTESDSTLTRDAPTGSSNWLGKQDLINVGRGFCMGAADTVPGVSGGTVALILGHYQRLVTAISHIDRHALKLITQRRWIDAWRHVDGRFLAAIGFGIGSGIVGLAGLMHWLLDHHMPATYAVFFGMILGSAWIVNQYVESWSAKRVLAFGLAFAAALGIGFLQPAASNLSLWYLFVSASIAICAMILPGISGAFVMLLLGVYAPVTGMIKQAAKLDFTGWMILQIAVFACGCLFGLLAFSRFLRWLLQHHQGTTMAALVGLMLGSVAKLWPLQSPTPESANEELKYRVMEYFSPATWSGTSVAILAGLAVAAAIAVLGLEKVGKTLSRPSSSSC